MKSIVYNLMREEVIYHGTYEIKGSDCLIKKAAGDSITGMVTAQMQPDGNIIRRHFAFFRLDGPSNHKGFPPRNSK